MYVSRRLVSLLAGASLALAACTSGTSPSATSAPTSAPTDAPASAEPTSTPEPVNATIALNFTLQAYASPLLWGIDKGYFAEEGINLEVLPTTGGDQSFQMMNEGQVEFAISDLDPVLSTHINGETDGKIIYVLLDKPTIGVISRTELSSPCDLEGKSFGTTQFSSGRTVVPFVMASNNCDPDQLTVEALDFGVLYASLFQGQIDTAELHRPGSWQNMKVQAAAQNVEVFFVPLYEWGLQSYSKTVITRQATIDENPELVAGFVRALDRSLEDALANASGEEMFELLDAADAQLPRDPTILDWEDFKEALGTPGPVDPEVVEYVLDLIKETRDVATDLDPESVYTNEFIPS